jgi:uncharacterized protein (UPF0332 family)
MLRAPYNPEGFLELANKLLTDKGYDPEGRTRTAIGRAYYAAFLVTFKKLQELGASFPEDYRIHKAVIEKLTAKNGGLGSKLNTLFDYRVDADYKMDAHVTNLGKTCCKFAEHIISRVKELG